MNDNRKYSVFITGCSSGIGRSLAWEFHKNGHRVIATARKIETLDELKNNGMTVLSLDITDQESIDKAVKDALNEFGGIDILVNNAGFGLMGPIVEIGLDDFRRQLETNVVGQLAMVKAVLPGMIEKGFGRIINVSSVSGVLATPFSGAYCSSKAAMNSISDSLRMELKPFGIDVISLQPGGIESKFGDNATKILNETIKKNSLYEKIKPFIAKRAMESQKGAMPSEKLAEKIVCCATSDSPPCLVRLGKSSTLLPAMKTLLPPKVIDRIFQKRFGISTMCE